MAMKLQSLMIMHMNDLEIILCVLYGHTHSKVRYVRKYFKFKFLKN
jgi:hypothetical protein